MKQKFFLGFDVTPRKEYIAHIEELTKRLEKFGEECVKLTKANIELNEAYERLLKKQPKHGKDGKFVKKNS